MNYPVHDSANLRMYAEIGGDVKYNVGVTVQTDMVQLNVCLRTEAQE